MFRGIWETQSWELYLPVKSNKIQEKLGKID